MKYLYHYTSIERWHMIQADGRLKLTDSALSPTSRTGPGVVWLTTDPHCAHGHGIDHTLDGTDKTRVRFTVALPNRDIRKWNEWALQHGIDRDWRRSLIDTGRGGSATWRITEKVIPASRWVEVLDRDTGAVLHGADLAA